MRAAHSTVALILIDREDNGLVHYVTVQFGQWRAGRKVRAVDNECIDKSKRPPIGELGNLQASGGGYWRNA